MRHRSLLTALLVAAGALPLLPVAAQKPPMIGPAKAAAMGAAATANARTASTADIGNATAPAAQAAGTQARPATRPAAKPATPATTDSADGSTSVAGRGTGAEMVFYREVFSYGAQSRRDPFVSLMKSGDLRPLLQDLRLVTILYDPTGRNSVAIMRDLSTKDQYRVKIGQTLGRMRVAQIQPKQVVFTIEEFGFSRQETLGLVADSTQARNR